MATGEDRAISKWLSILARRGGAAYPIALALPIVGGALLVAQAYVLAGILDDAIVKGVAPTALTPAIVLLGALLGTRALLSGAGEIAAVRAGESVKSKLRQALIGTIIGKRTDELNAKASGALSSAVVEQVEALDGYLVRYLPAMVQASLLPLAFAVVILPVDWVVGLLFLFTAPLIPVFMALAGWGAEAASRAQAAALGQLSGRFADRLRGLVTLKLFGREAAEIEAVGIASEDLRRRTMTVMRIAFLSSAVLEFFAALGVAGVALYVGLTFLGLVPLHAGTLTLSAGMFCLLMAPEVYQPLRLLAAHYHDRASAKAAAAEIASQLGGLPTPGEAPIPAAAATPAAQAGPAAIDISDLRVMTPQGRAVITDCSLEVAPGEHVAILGASGVGKSTLIETIARLRAFSGDITIDNVALDVFAESALRQRVALVGQRPRIFAGSIADNIRLGRHNACRTAVELAAMGAHVNDFAQSLPAGLDTRLGEDGLGLSGGEAHRVALARLYLRDPGLVLLDEPTAHLDTVTEGAVLDALMAFAAGRTLIVATHSLAVAARMDKVYRLVSGRLLPAPKPVLLQRGAA